MENPVELMEDKINDLLGMIQGYEREMKREAAGREPQDPVAKLAGFQTTRTGWLRDLCEQMEEIVRDMLDRVQNVDLAEAGRFTGRPDDVSATHRAKGLHG